MKLDNEEDYKKEFGSSAKGNFTVIDSIGIPHPYMITPEHIQYTEGVYLDIAGAEKKGACCEICQKSGDKILSLAEHEKALLVECKANIKSGKKTSKELKDFLLKIKKKTAENGYAGFAFLDRRTK